MIAQVQPKPSQTDALRANVISLFQYLKAVDEAKSKVTRDVREYGDGNIFWLGRTENVPLCTARCFRNGNTNSDLEEDWLTVRKLPKPKPPIPPEELRSCLDPESGHNPDKPPKLISRDADRPGKQGKGNLFGEYEKKEAPNDRQQLVLSSFEAFLRGPWESWKAEYETWQERQTSVYDRLYHIRAALDRSAGEMELILGIGFLSWTVNGHEVRRHLIEARVDLAFVADDGTFILRPAADGARLTLVEDMLDADQRPSNGVRKQAEVALEATADDPWDFGTVDKCLRTYTNGLPPNGGEYKPTFFQATTPGDEPRVDFAPALILRERRARGFERVMTSILENLETGDTIPALVRQLVSEPDHLAKETDTPVSVGQVTPPPHGRTYFPLPANEDQLEIINRFNGSPGVLVQGPPGTGKSHTIANLICHLLATGKRILVTAQTARALEVLREKLPEPVRSLCLMALGTDRTSQRLREKGVHEIIEKMGQWKKHSAESEIRQMEQELDNLCRRDSELECDLRTRRESETHRQSIPGTIYGGTTQVIADKVHRNRDQYGWFRDAVDPHSMPVLRSEELFGYRDGLLRFPTERQAELSMRRQEVPTDDTLPSLVAAYHTVRSRLPSPDPGDNELQTAELNDIRTALDALQTLQEKVRSARSRTPPWAKPAIDDVLSGNGAIWEGKHTDATDIFGHLRTGGWLGFWFLRPKVVRRTKYLFSDVMFTGIVAPLSSPRHVLLRNLEEACNQLGLVVDLRQMTTEANVLMDRLAIDKRKSFDDSDAISELVTRCDRELNRRELATLSGQLVSWVSAVRSFAEAPGAHPVGRKLADALAQRDLATVKATLYEIRTLDSAAEDLAHWQVLAGRVKEVCPLLAAQMAGTPNEPDWNSRLDTWTDAWNWARADAWVRHFTDPARGAAAAADLVITKQRIKDGLLRLAEIKAWQSCFNSMTEGNRKALVAWAIMVKRIGAGKGKMANAKAVKARKLFEQCQAAIPACVIPLNQVFESLPPRPEMFDVVIVDEASQCGPESAVLLYLAKKIIIVGDEKQIAPAPDGITDEIRNVLAHRYLTGLPEFSRVHFERSSSLYGIGEVQIERPILLKEHFRCVAEIIRFSNGHFYDNKLIPLRQPPLERFEPLQVRLVSDGNCEGGESTLFNQPEAEQVVEGIRKCCADPRYNDKSMGVITLRRGNQDKKIERLLLTAIGPEEMAKRKIICGSARSFQGDERDVIFLSMVVAPNRNFISLTTREFEQQFNVAASRAKEQMWLFHSVSPEDIGNKDCLRYKLLTFFFDPVTDGARTFGIDLSDLRTKAELTIRPEKVPPPFDSWFEVDVYLRLVGRGYHTVPQYQAGRYKIDMLVQYADRSLAVECDGDVWHGPDRCDADMARQRQLERAGWPFWRVWGSEYYHNPEKALASLWRRLDELRIRPITSGSASN